MLNNDYRIVVKNQLGNKSYTMDLYGDLDMNVIFNIVDIREPETRKSNYTKELSIPATKNNNIIFDFILDNGWSPTKFNPNLRLPATLYHNTDIMIDGYLQLISVTKNFDSIDEYNIIIYGELSTLFTRIQNVNLSDLDLSEYNHIWNRDNIENSWDKYIWKNGKKQTFQLGEGYVYPFEWRGRTDNHMNTEDFLPSFYVKTIWDKIFRLGGKEYESNFLESDYFRKLIIPFNKGKLLLNQSETEQREFRATQTNSIKLNTMDATIAATSPNLLLTFNTEKDPYNLFNNETTFKPVYKQNSVISSKINLKFTYRLIGQPSGTIFYIAGDDLTGYIKLWNKTKGIFEYTENFSVIHPRTGISSINNDISVEITKLLDFTTILEPNNEYQIYVEWKIPKGKYQSKFINFLGQSLFGAIDCYIMPQSDFYSVLNDKTKKDGDTLDFSNILSEDVTCDEFIKSINNMFNLYWIPTNENTFRIEPRDDLYNNDSVRQLNWDYLLDEDNPVTITPLSELTSKKYTLKYTEDDDYQNDQYQTSFNETYGQKTIDINNDFVVDESNIELVFSPTPMINHHSTDRVVPSYVVRKDGFYETTDTNIRILIYGGLLPTTFTWGFIGNSSQGRKGMSKYPYAGHFDNPFLPNEDINYTKAKNYYWKWRTSTNSNLFNRFWVNTINDIISPDSHMLSFTIHLNPYDIVSLNLFDTIYIKGVNYHINKIDYNVKSELATIELLKITSSLPIIPLKKISNSVYDQTFGGNGTSWKSNNSIVTSDSNYGGGGFHWSDWKFDKWTWDEWNNNGDGYYDKWSFINDYRDKSWGNPHSIDIGDKNWWGQYSDSEPTWKNWKNFESGLSHNVNNNFYDKDRFITINGEYNFVGSESQYISVLGQHNTIDNNCYNVSVVGNNNRVKSGVNNVSIVGENVFATESNTSYINGKIIKDGVILTEINYYNGSIDEVQNVFGSESCMTNNKCGIDAVKNLGCDFCEVDFINGGIDGNDDNDVNNLPNTLIPNDLGLTTEGLQQIALY